MTLLQSYLASFVCAVSAFVTDAMRYSRRASSNRSSPSAIAEETLILRPFTLESQTHQCSSHHVIRLDLDREYFDSPMHQSESAIQLPFSGSSDALASTLKTIKASSSRTIVK